MKTRTVGVIAAMDCEAEPLKARLKPLKETSTSRGALFTLAGERTAWALMVSGVGKCNAAAAAAVLIDRCRPDLLFNLGLCGSLSPDIGVGEVREVSACFQYDFDLSEADGVPPFQLPGFASPRIPLRRTGLFPAGVCATGDRFTSDPGQAEWLSRAGGELREMELAAIAQTAGKLPLLSLKAVTDRAGEHSVEEYYARKEAGLRALDAAFEQVFRFLEEGGRLL